MSLSLPRPCLRARFRPPSTRSPAQQVPNQFGTQRYALLFEPGTYGSAANPLIFQVGYYTEVAGLGASPGDVVINGSVDVFNQCSADSGCIALDNFWRSLSNLTINAIGLSGCQANTEFWAVSQAAPMRRVQVNGQTSFMDYCSAGPQFASGGFVSDSVFTGGSVVNGSQQQFIVQELEPGRLVERGMGPGLRRRQRGARAKLRHGGRAAVHDAGDHPGVEGDTVPVHDFERTVPGAGARAAAEFGRPVLDFGI